MALSKTSNHTFESELLLSLLFPDLAWGSANKKTNGEALLEIKHVEIGQRTQSTTRWLSPKRMFFFQWKVGASHLQEENKHIEPLRISDVIEQEENGPKRFGWKIISASCWWTKLGDIWRLTFHVLVLVHRYSGEIKSVRTNSVAGSKVILG